ncbi:MAG: reverse transcriptase domain-containing protein, partial [bacterium]
MDTEMANLRNLGCWILVPRSSLPPNTPIMDTRWTYRKKHDENGNCIKYRSRLVAKGFTQILGVNYFESFSPVASFVTIRTLFALTALPMFKVY